jgi:hypothetical protein
MCDTQPAVRALQRAVCSKWIGKRIVSTIQTASLSSCSLINSAVLAFELSSSLTGGTLLSETGSLLQLKSCRMVTRHPQPVFRDMCQSRYQIYDAVLDQSQP